MFTVFHYIAAANTDEAAALCNQCGLEVYNTEDIANGLYEIANDGNEGFKAVMAIHPEKDVIIDQFAGADGTVYYDQNGRCTSCRMAGTLIQTNQANGGNSTASAATLPHKNNSNDLIILGIIALTLTAIILHNNKN